jgi:hypothetical protein
MATSNEFGRLHISMAVAPGLGIRHALPAERRGDQIGGTDPDPSAGEEDSLLDEWYPVKRPALRSHEGHRSPRHRRSPRS